MAALHPHIRPVEPEDAATWQRMRSELWPGEDEEHGNVIARFFAGERADPRDVLLAETAEGTVGFAELSIRTDLPAFEEQEIGYIEGLYVAPQVRHQGVARMLLVASRQWAVEQGCTGFASDRNDRIIVDRSFAPGNA